jgi:hypothetical protein
MLFSLSIAKQFGRLARKMEMANFILSSFTFFYNSTATAKCKKRLKYYLQM